MTIVAVKLPHGLQVTTAGRVINLNGPNEGYDPDNLPKNGALRDDAAVSAGYGLTELKGDDDKAFARWVNDVTFKDGDKTKGKLDEPFKALENGSIMTFASMSDARAELKSISESVVTGFEGLGQEDIKKAGIEQNPDAKK